MNKKLTLEQEKEVCNLYINKLSGIVLAKKYNIDKATIYRILKRHDIYIRPNSLSNRKYELNENYFDEIDNQDKAYFLGLLYADGCNAPKYKMVALGLQEKDKEILLKLNNLLQPTKPLLFTKGYKKNMLGRVINIKNSYKLVINNRHISETLVKHGVVQAKTFKLKFPDWLREDLKPHFIRGYIDGDGCIYVDHKNHDNRKSMISLISTNNFCIGLSKYLKNKLNINTGIWSCHNSDIINVLGIRGRHQITKVINLIYNDANLFFKRKKDKADEIIRYKKKVI